MRENFLVYAAPRQYLKTLTGSGPVLAQPSASTRRITAAAIRQDAIDLPDPRQFVYGLHGIVQLIERTVERDPEIWSGLDHPANVIEGQLAALGEANHDAVDAETGEVDRCRAQHPQFIRTHSIPGVLAHHDPERQCRLLRDRSNEGERRRQTSVSNVADDFQAVGSSSCGLSSIGDGLNDDFQQYAVH